MMENAIPGFLSREALHMDNICSPVVYFMNLEGGLEGNQFFPLKELLKVYTTTSWLFKLGFTAERRSEGIVCA